MSRLLDLICYCYAANKPLTLLMVFSLVGMLVSFTGLAFDHRLIQGVHAWIKPCKFSVSLFVYGATLLWFTGFIQGNRKLILFASSGALLGTIVELSAIIMQAHRGVTSHFNVSTPFDHAVWIAIKVGILPVSLALIIVYALLLKQKHLPVALGLSLRLGALLTIIGLIPGLMMILPDPMQDAITNYKQFDGHTVGSPEGGPGIPWLGWSTKSGDLRVAHFLGIHALQVLPFLGFFIDRHCLCLPLQRQTQLIWNAALTYLMVVVLLTWQALRAESFFAPQFDTLLPALIMIGSSVSWALLTVAPELKLVVPMALRKRT